MIIAFYPGAGGNKYLLSLNNRQWQTHGRYYDNEIINQLPFYRYLYNDSNVIVENALILTHCVHTPLLKKLWPDSKITVLLFDLKSCLRREWVLKGHNAYIDKLPGPDVLEFYDAIRDPSWPVITCVTDLDKLPCKIKKEFDTEYSTMINPTHPDAVLKKKYSIEIDSALANISWHKKYYSDYPLNLDYCDTLVDNNTISSFVFHMQKELDLYRSQVYDDCWKQLHE